MENKMEENYQKEYRTGCRYLLRVIIAIVIMAVVSVTILMCGCSPKVIERTVVSHDTTYIDKLRRDSIYVKDSIFLHMWHEGDTVYVERDRWHTQWRDRLIKDTAYVSRTDTLTVTREKEVKKPLSGWHWFQIWTGRLVLIALAVLVIVAMLRRYRILHLFNRKSNCEE